jgi:hypothetical protein
LILLQAPAWAVQLEVKLLPVLISKKLKSFF